MGNKNKEEARDLEEAIVLLREVERNVRDGKLFGSLTATLPASGSNHPIALAKVAIFALAGSVLAFGRVPRAGLRPDPETYRPAFRLPLPRRRRNIGKSWPTIHVGSFLLRADGP
jgi:hypothetical protein